MSSPTLVISCVFANSHSIGWGDITLWFRFAFHCWLVTTYGSNRIVAHLSVALLLGVKWFVRLKGPSGKDSITLRVMWTTFVKIISLPLHRANWALNRSPRDITSVRQSTTKTRTNVSLQTRVGGKPATFHGWMDNLYIICISTSTSVFYVPTSLPT